MSLNILNSIARNDERFAVLKSRLLASAAPLSLMLLLLSAVSEPVLAQNAAPAASVPGTLDPVVVNPVRRKAKRAVTPTRTRNAGTVRRAPARVVAPVAPVAVVPGYVLTGPLNGNTVASSSSRLGLTVRQTPATVEIVDQQQIQEQGYRTTSDVAQGAVGVTSGDGPGDPAAFSMRGFTNSQINMLYNGIKIGPQNMTSRPMDTANLERVEFLKGPASLMSGEGATGGAINFVTKQPTSGPVRNDAYFSWDSLNSFRAQYGSGGSTLIDGLDYRFDISRSALNGFIDDTDTKLFNVSGQLNYRVSSDFKVWAAIEYKQDKSHAYWGTPLVPFAFSGANATSGIVSGNYVSNYNGTNLGPVTIDRRTLNTNYNVFDNYLKANELWARRFRMEYRQQSDAEEPDLRLRCPAGMAQQ